MEHRAEIRGAVLIAGEGSLGAARVELASADTGRLLAAASIAPDGTFVLPNTVSSACGVSMIRVSVYQASRLLWRSLRSPEELQRGDLQIRLAAHLPPSVVQGRVCDPRGRAVGGVLLKLYGLEEDHEGMLRKVRLGVTVSDPRGGYRFRPRRANSLHPGTLLRVRAEGADGAGLGCAVHLLGDRSIYEVNVHLREAPKTRVQRWFSGIFPGLDAPVTAS